MTPPKRQKLKVGDVFRVSLDGLTDKYFQFVATDTTQLDSDVIRVFHNTYGAGCSVTVEQIVHSPIDFYAHVFLRIGLKQGRWQKIGHADETGKTDILFRNSNDYGNPKVTTSLNWYVWKPNETFKRIGKLTTNYEGAEIGVVVPADSLVHRMRTGRYDFVFPDY